MRAQHDKRLPSWLIGLILVIVIAIGSFLAYTKKLPWGHKYTTKAVFASAQSVRPSSPVRIAGVNVGKVTSVEPLGSAETEEITAQTGGDRAGPRRRARRRRPSVVTMELNDDALPLHEDATFKLRPRLFLEGNYFVDVSPGEPERGGRRGRRDVPDQPDVLLGPARPGADDAAGRRPRRTSRSSSTSSATR